MAWLVLSALFSLAWGYNYSRVIDIPPPALVGDEWDTSTHEKYTVRMPGAQPAMDDHYFHHGEAFHINQTMFVTSFKPVVAEVVHHVLLYREDHKRHSEVMWAWANHGSPLVLPKPIAFVIPVGTSWKMTVHYKRKQDEKDYSGVEMTMIAESTLRSLPNPPEICPANIILLAAASMSKVDGVPPKPADMKGIREFQKTEWVAAASHVHQSPTPHYIFAYRTHAHLMGTLIEGFRYHDGVETKIASRSPQQPQTFVRFEGEDKSRKWTVLQNDKLQTFCYYDQFRQFGSLFHLEMCNLYLMTFALPNSASAVKA
eukprot:g15903.t1